MANIFPTDSKARKDIPICTGVLDYFPLALAEVAKISVLGNKQHNPGEPLHWEKEKSTDHADTIIRHLAERGGFDTDGSRHSAKLAWRALANLQLELEAEHIQQPSAGDDPKTIVHLADDKL
ncbi:MAG: dATP/dGTP diphosphohydrolase domain-containing protein [Patescibacteria group bacterium]